VILVTGATGFIGRAIVTRLLAADRDVAILARGRDGLDARTRVLAALDRTVDARRLVVIEADLTAPGALVAAVGHRREWIETIVHAAGDTAFVPAAPGPFVAGHVEGPVALLRALARRGLARWAQLSTAFVCGERTGPVLECEGDVGQRFHNVYERVKLDAEIAIRAAGRETGVDVRILRPSIVVGAAPATSGGDPSNLFFAFIRLLAVLARWRRDERALRIEAAPAAPFNIVPRDYVAAATVALADDPGAAGGTFHLVVRDPPSQAAMLAMLVERLGPRGLTLLDAATTPLADPSPLERRIARMLGPYRAYLTQHVRFDDRAAAARLATIGVAATGLAPAEVGRLVDLALGGTSPAVAAPVAGS
jgi:nucleoside-diphosphate-sugar epimerase